LHISSLKKQISENNYYVFHVGGWGFFFPGLIYLRNNLAPRPFPVTGVIHSLNAKQASFHALKVCTAPVLPFDSIICTSNCGKKALRKLFEATENNFSKMAVKYGGKMNVIPLGIDDIYRTIPGRSQSRRTLGIDEDCFVILSLGRLATGEKMDFLPFLAAVKRFIEKNKGEKILLIIAGAADGDEQRFIRNIINEKRLGDTTRLFLNFENDKKPLLYSAADIYTAPIDNLQETFGISVIEAMAHECAVVVSDFNGYREIVDNDINGIKIPTFWADATNDFEEICEIMNFPTYQLILSQSIAVDIDKLVNAFQQLLDSPQKRIALAKAAREKVKQNYFWSDIINQYNALWQQLSEHAENYSVKFEKVKNPWEIDYWSIFSHYPSEIVSEDSTISLSEYGKEVLESGNVPLSYSDISASVILPELVGVALKVIDQKRITVKQFNVSLQKHAMLSGSTGLYYLLWMAKYNLVSIS
jgi:glycosyltransferase involved in cell wall biosynthesis